MSFRVTRGVEKLFDAPSLSAKPLRLLVTDDRIEKLADVGAGWWQVRLLTGPADEGHVRAEGLSPADEADAAKVEIDPITFFAQIMFAARRHGANPHYLFAVAFKESGLRNVTNAAGAIGPFQFMRPTWSDLVRDHGEATRTGATDIDRPEKQVVFAAIAASQHLEALSRSLDRVPEGRELYLAHLLGLAGGTAVLTTGQGTDVATALATVVTPKRAQKMVVANAPLLARGDGSAATREEVLKAVEEWLLPGYVEAGRIFRMLHPDLVADGPPSGGKRSDDPPWLATALGELGVEEFREPGRRNPEVEKYFSATLHPKTDDSTDWCAAFVSWCMAKSGDAEVAERSRRSARAADWKKWGQRIVEPRRGAVGVAPPPPGSKSSGHVGFVTGWEGEHLTLLGGNQAPKLGSNARTVCENRRRAADIELRWLE